MELQYDFDDAYKRMLHAVGVTTQQGLAEALEIRQASVASAKSRKTIPPAWMLTVLHKFQINPDWILYGGEEKKYLMPTNTNEDANDIQGCRGKDSLVHSKGVSDTAPEMP